MLLRPRHPAFSRRCCRLLVPLLLLVLSAQAQGPGEGGPGPGAQATNAPLDGGVSLLLAVGAAYGLRWLQRRQGA